MNSGETPFGQDRLTVLQTGTSEHANTTRTVQLPVCLYLCVPTLVDTASSLLLDWKGTEEQQLGVINKTEYKFVHWYQSVCPYKHHNNNNGEM